MARILRKMSHKKATDTNMSQKVKIKGKIKLYPEYKDSGIEWLGKIPKHWNVKKMKFNTSIRFSNVNKKSEKNEEGVRLCNYVDVYHNDFITLKLNFMNATASKEEIRKFRLNIGNVILTKDSESWDDIAVPAYVAESEDKLLCGYHLAQIKPIVKILNGKFLFWILSGNAFNYQYKVEAKGVTRYGLSNYALSNSRIVLLPIDEQKTIADYLDKKTAQIDDLIRKKEKIIELLKEERIAVINNVVTRGIDPNVKLKDSGIEWLGKIPKQWELKKLRYLGQFQNGISKGAEYFGSGYPFLSYGDVYNNMVLPRIVKGLAQSSKDEKGKMSVKEGDVFFTRTSETIEEIGIASICLQKIQDAVFSGFLIRFRPSVKGIIKEFSKYYFRNNITQKFFTKEMNIVTRASLAQELLKRLPVLLPPYLEQKQIANYLDKKTSQIDNQLNSEKKLIKLLKEYRTALISEVVTGKIDVRNKYDKKNGI